ncbi:MAG TPA: immunoglobulin domain-containing protein, partial [Chitinispirillaceae bacterium]|nr:immunoglobulin domain-containing protein [Chitinispirillaceae bacterium]
TVPIELPTNSLFGQNVFTWIVPSDFIGLDTLSFVVSDNGYPKMSDTETVIITVTQTPNVPSIVIKNETNVRPGQLCTLKIVVSDLDAGQKVAVLVSGAPEGATIIGDSLFICRIPENAASSYSIIFKASDNGIPPLSATASTSLMVLSESQNKSPIWDADTIEVDMYDTSGYSLVLAKRCNDAYKDSLTWRLLPGLPDNDSIHNGVYYFRASVSLIGTHYSSIVVSVPDGTSDTLLIKMTIKLLPERSVQLSTIRFSTGTLRELTAIIPDTIRDTVSYSDSSLSLSFGLWDSTSKVIVQGKELSAGVKTASITAIVGVNTITVKLKLGPSLEQTYVVVVVRKPNSTEPLEKKPDGLKIDSAGSSWIRIKWNDLPGALSYVVERSVSNDQSFSLLDTVTSNTLVDTGLTPGTLYYYRVKAFNSVSTTGFGESVSGTTLVKPSITIQPNDTALVIGKPLSLKCSASGVAIKIQWRKNGIAMAGKTTEELSFTAITITDTGTYTILVWSGEDSVVSKPFKISVFPAKPSGVVATARSASSVSVSWTAAEGGQKYTVVRAAASGAYTLVDSVTEISYVDTMLLEGTLYNYRVIAVNSAGISDSSSIASVTTWTGPVITSDLPATLSLNAGQPLNLSIVASGTPQCIYQWHKNGSPITGETTSSFSINQVVPADSGIYTVIVINSVRAVTSKQVKVSIKPVYRLQLVSAPAVGGSITGGKDSTYVAGTQLTLTAVPKSGYAFKYWGTNTSATGMSIQVIMNKDTTITANFIRQFTLTMSVSGTGSTSPGSGTSVVVDSGLPTTITATAGTGNKFSRWATTAAGVVLGSATSANTTVTLTQANATLQAVFRGYTFNNALPLSEFSSVNLQKVITGTDSGYYVVGGADDQGLVIRLNSQGGVVWKKRYQYAYTLNSITQLATEYILPTYSNNGACIMKMAANGNELITWCHAYNEGKTVIDAKPVTDGFILAANAGGTAYILKFASSGDSLWTKAFKPGTYDNFDGCIVTNDNGVLAFGSSSVGSTAYVLKTNSSGTKIWDNMFENQFYSSAHGTNVKSAIEITDGYVFAGSSSSNPASNNPAAAVGTLMKTTKAGVVTWTKYYDCFRSLKKVVQVENGFVIAGDTYTKGPGGCDMLLAKTSSAGDTLWTRVFGTATGEEQCLSMDITKDGGFILLGSTGMIVKTDENGNIE